MNFRRLIAHAFACALLFATTAAYASQGSLIIPTTGTLSGLQAMTDVNAATASGSQTILFGIAGGGANYTGVQDSSVYH